MFKKSRFSIICVISFLICVIGVFAQEQLTITTYYPSPYGSYNELQLFPHASAVTPCNATTKGTMYYDSDDNQIKVCDGVGNWNVIGFWNGSGNDIYNINTGDVGIGTTSPSYKLDVSGSINGVNIYQNGNQVLDGAGTSGYIPRYSDSNTLTNSVIYQSGNNVGIGTTSPASILDVAGGVKVSQDNATCSAAKAGTMRYNGNTIEYCNGTQWVRWGGPVSWDCQKKNATSLDSQSLPAIASCDIGYTLITGGCDGANEAPHGSRPIFNGNMAVGWICDETGSVTTLEAVAWCCR